jgi:uncharacterized protein (DUF1778 family)
VALTVRVTRHLEHRIRAARLPGETVSGFLLSAIISELDRRNAAVTRSDEGHGVDLKA